ncbi:MAG: tetratricopeptide repeat protein, partial [Gemmataceae bacterium]
MRSVPLFKSLRSLWWIALIGAVGFTAMWAAFFTYSTWFAPTHPLPELSLESVEPEVANLVQAEMRRLQEQPRSSEAWGRFGKILLANGLAEPAMYCFEQAARLDRREPRWPYYQVEYNAIRDVSRAEALLRSAVALNQKASPENHAPRLRLVELLLSQGRLDEAENELAPMVGLDSRDPRIRYNRGMLAFHREQWEKARDALAPLASDPVASRLVMAPLSMIYKRLGQAEKADEYTRRASELAGKDDSWDDPYLSEYKNLNVRKDLRLRMAYYAEEMSRLQEGLEVLKKVVREVGENDPISHLALGNNLMKQGQFKAAADVYRRTLQLAPSSSRTLDMLSLALSAEGERLRQQGDSKQA